MSSLATLVKLLLLHLPGALLFGFISYYAFGFGQMGEHWYVLDLTALTLPFMLAIASYLRGHPLAIAALPAFLWVVFCVMAGMPYLAHNLFVLPAIFYTFVVATAWRRGR